MIPGQLIEEIRLLWCEECADGPLSYEFGYDPDVDEPCTSGAEDLCRERTRKVITRIGKAYADGLPLPGEVSRTDEVGTPFFDWLEEMPEEGTVIFLRKEATGKEEEV